MNAEPLHLLLADDDQDDRLFFEEALKELAQPAKLATVHDGEQLMHRLHQNSKQLPHVLFLDLNLPRKNGLECLSEIKNNKKLKSLFVVIFSTTSEQSLLDLLYKNGAQHFIRKPTEFSQLKKVIHQALAIIKKKGSKQPPKGRFVLTGDY